MFYVCFKPNPIELPSLGVVIGPVSADTAGAYCSSWPFLSQRFATISLSDVHQGNFLTSRCATVWCP